MLIAEITLYFALATIFLIAIIRRSKKWAIALQKYYIHIGDDVIPGMSEDFKPHWYQILLRIMIIFAAVVLVLMAFSIIFGPVCAGDQGYCTALYGQHYIYTP